MFGNRQQEELLQEIATLRARIAELEANGARQIWVDSVTGLLSGRAFRSRLAEEVHRSARYRRPLSVAVIAVDDFGALEVRRGFKAGDELLGVVARRLSQGTRENDLVGRIAEAEFGLLMSDTKAQDAMAALERMLVELELAGEGASRAAGLSMGIAGHEPGLSAEGLLANARMACAQAQQSGGGRAVVAGSVALAAAAAEAGNTQRDAIEALALALTSGERGSYAGEYSEELIEICGAVARNLGCSPAEVETIKSAALLHDIGKVAIPDEILRKPGPLTPEEWSLMEQHSVVGERIVRALPGLGTVARIVRHEHERWDGSGYPDGLAGEEIPLGSRIIIAADAYHAMISERPYRPARTHAEAIEEISKCSGTQFDPQVTGALIGHLYGKRQAGSLTPR